MIGKSAEELRGMGRLSKPMEVALLRIDYSKSATMTKRRGKRGSPCLTPLFVVNSFPSHSIQEDL
jgi:hypothetical protein